VDELVEKSELTSSEVLAALCEMEMKGIVRQMPGEQFVKVLLSPELLNADAPLQHLIENPSL